MHHWILYSNGALKFTTSTSFHRCFHHIQTNHLDQLKELVHNISKFRSDVYFQTDDNYCTNYLQCSKYVLNIKWALMYVFFRKYAVVSFHLMFQISFLLQLHVGRRLIRLFHVILFLRISYFWNGRSISIDQT